MSKKEGKNVAFLCDFENLSISLRNRGYVISWEKLIDKLERDYGRLLHMKIFLPSYSLFDTTYEFREKLIPRINYAEIIATTEDVDEESVTDWQMKNVALHILEHQRPDILVLASGDGYFIDVAQEFERQGVRVIILATSSQTMHRGLEKTYDDKKREIIFLMQYMLDDDDMPTELVRKRERCRLLRGEFKSLYKILLSNSQSAISKDNHIFEMVGLVYSIASAKQEFMWDILREDLYHAQRFLDMGCSSSECQLALEFLAGRFGKSTKEAAIKVDLASGKWQIDQESRLSRCISDKIREPSHRITQ